MFTALACTLATSILGLLAILFAPLISDSAPTLTVGSLEKGFQVSSSHIFLKWDSFRPFLASPSGNFALGFVEEAPGNYSYILALMYTIRSGNASLRSQIPADQLQDAPFNMEMVWSANPDSPSRGDAIFTLNEQGNLLLSDASSKATLWSAGTASTGPLKLSLADSGNVVLSSSSNISANASILWQSFEHPTDSLLQGQNFTANMRLTASLRHTAMSNIQGASVLFKMEVDGIGLYLAELGQNSSHELMYWKLEADQETATIDSPNSTIYARIDSMGYLGMFETEDERVSYEVFYTYNSSDVSHRRLKLDSDGNLRVYYWEEASWHVDYEAVEELCALPSACGPYGICNISGECMCVARSVISSNGSGSGVNQSVSFAKVNGSDATQGCMLENAESFIDDVGSCSSGKPEYKGLFVQLVGMDSLFHDPTAAANASSVEDCEGLCRADCECTAFFYSKKSKCFLAYELAEHSLVQTGDIDDLAFLKLGSAAAMSMQASFRAPSSNVQATGRPAGAGGRRSTVVGAIIAAFAGVFFVVGMLCGFAVYYRRRSRSAAAAAAAQAGNSDLEEKAFLSEVPGLPPFVRYRELESYSSDFSRQRRAGLLGSLYEGTLAVGGARVAIARLTILNRLDLHDIKLTLASVGRMTHPNIARLCSYSIDGANLALCYEYPPNGRWLDLAALSWQQRVKVAMGVARALATLHGGKMVHGLLSLEAVLVAAGGCEARVVGVGVAELVVNRLAAPLYLAQPPDLAEAGDVLQYGVVLTELLTGKRVKGDPATWRLRWRDAIGQGRPLQLLDNVVVADAKRLESHDLLLRLATSAGLCLHPSPLQRPPMSTLLRILDGSLDAATLPPV